MKTIDFSKHDAHFLISSKYSDSSWKEKKILWRQTIHIWKNLCLCYVKPITKNVKGGRMIKIGAKYVFTKEALLNYGYILTSFYCIICRSTKSNYLKDASLDCWKLKARVLTCNLPAILFDLVHWHLYLWPLYFFAWHQYGHVLFILIDCAKHFAES